MAYDDTGIPVSSKILVVREGWSYPSMRIYRGDVRRNSGESLENVPEAERIGVTTNDIVSTGKDKSKKKKKTDSNDVPDAEDRIVAGLGLNDKNTNKYFLKKKASNKFLIKRAETPAKTDGDKPVTQDMLRDTQIKAHEAERFGDVEVFERGSGQKAPTMLKFLSNPQFRMLVPLLPLLGKWGAIAAMAYPIVSQGVSSALNIPSMREQAFKRFMYDREDTGGGRKTPHTYKGLAKYIVDPGSLVAKGKKFVQSMFGAPILPPELKPDTVYAENTTPPPATGGTSTGSV